MIQNIQNAPILARVTKNGTTHEKCNHPQKNIKINNNVRTMYYVFVCDNAIVHLRFFQVLCSDCYTMAS